MFFNKKTKGHPGQFKENEVYCALLGDWVDTLVGCLENCDERGDYLNADIEGRVLNSAPSFNRAAKRAGFELPKDIKKQSIHVYIVKQFVKIKRTQLLKFLQQKKLIEKNY